MKKHLTIYCLKWQDNPSLSFCFKFANQKIYNRKQLMIMSNEFPPPVAERNVVSVPVVSEKKGLAVAAMVLSIVGAILGLVPILGLIAIVCGTLAVIFGFITFKRAKGFALTGIIVGFIAISLGAAGVIIVDKAFDDLERDLNDLQYES